jgi:biotin carboxyl carrier protein
MFGCAKSMEEKQIVKKDKNITIKLEAVVYPSVNHKVTSPFSGKIKYVFAKNGQKVKKR